METFLAGEHREWNRDHVHWLEDLERWHKEHEHLRRDLHGLAAGLASLESRYELHRQGMVALEQRLARHEHRVSAGGRPAESGPEAYEHETEFAMHAKLRDQHDDLRKHHVALMQAAAGLRRLLEDPGKEEP